MRSPGQATDNDTFHPGPVIFGAVASTASNRHQESHRGRRPGHDRVAPSDLLDAQRFQVLDHSLFEVLRHEQLRDAIPSCPCPYSP